MTTTTTSPFPSPTAPRRSSTPLTPSQCKHTRLTPIDDCYNFPSFIVIVATSFSFIISGGRWLLRLNKNGGLCHVVMVDHRNGATTTCSPFIVIYLSLFPLDVRLYVSLSLSQMDLGQGMNIGRGIKNQGTAWGTQHFCWYTQQFSKIPKMLLWVFSVINNILAFSFLQRLFFFS